MATITSLPFEPYSIAFSGSPGGVISHFDSVTASYEYEDLDQYQSADAFPCYTGKMSADPQIAFSTSSIREVLEECTTAHAIARAYVAGSDTADLFYRQHAFGGTRVAAATGSHIRARLTGSLMLYWNTITASQSQPAKINAVLKTAYDNTNTPMVIAGSQTIDNADRICQRQYTLGPVNLGSNQLLDVTEMTWDNRIQLMSRRTGGLATPAWCSIAKFAPVVTLKVDNLNNCLDAIGGATTTTLAVYLRQLKETGFYYSNASSEHIKLTLTGKCMYSTQMIDSTNPAAGTISLQLSAGSTSGVIDANFFTVAVATAIT